MAKFGVELIDIISGREKFLQLTIDGNKVLDNFSKSLESKYESDFRSILSYMQFVAEGRSMPQNKFKDITTDKSICKEYEFKKNDIRIYAIKTPSGKVIVLCGYKNNQKQDIRRFRSLIDQIKNLLL